MLRKIWIVLMAALLAGCAAYHDVNKDRLENLPQHYSQFDMILAWEVKPEGATTVVDGVVKNIRYSSMVGIEVWVAVIDASGKTRDRSVSFIIPNQLRQDEIAQFSIKMPVQVEPGTRLRFTYKYRGNEGGSSHGGGGGNWTQSFDVVVPTR